MKVASLPNGHVLGFPDDAEDPHMDAAVQGYMTARGDIPPAVDPTLAILQGLARIAEMQQQNAHREEVFLQSIMTALTAPKRIAYDDAGRPVGVTVGN